MITDFQLRNLRRSCETLIKDIALATEKASAFQDNVDVEFGTLTGRESAPERSREKPDRFYSFVCYDVAVYIRRFNRNSHKSDFVYKVICRNFFIDFAKDFNLTVNRSLDGFTVVCDSFSQAVSLYLYCVKYITVSFYSKQESLLFGDLY